MIRLRSDVTVILTGVARANAIAIENYFLLILDIEQCGPLEGPLVLALAGSGLSLFIWHGLVIVDGGILT
jgi:hypothetical protein